MRKTFSLLVLLLVLAPVLALFQNMTLLPPDYDFCMAPMAINDEWSNEVQVQVDGFSENMMEPKFSNDQKVLFFNDKPASGDNNMNIHYAVLQSSGHYQYAGVLPGTVSNGLDGVPVIDGANRFYFTSNRNWIETTGSIYGGQLALGNKGLLVVNPASVDRYLPRKAPGEIDMDIDISYDGLTAISSRAFFSDNKPFPDYGVLKGFNMSNYVMTSNPILDIFLAPVNRKECVVYAPNLSQNKLELYFTFYQQGKVPALNGFHIAVTKRYSIYQQFGQGKVIAGIKGNLTEAPSLTTNDGQKNLIFHKIDPATGKFRIYKVSRL